jgi:hypothetical protein
VVVVQLDPHQIVLDLEELHQCFQQLHQLVVEEVDIEHVEQIIDQEDQEVEHLVVLYNQQVEQETHHQYHRHKVIQVEVITQDGLQEEEVELV